MMAFFIFILWLCILEVEGFLAAMYILGKQERLSLPLALGLSLGTLINVLLMFLYTVAHIPLVWWTLLIGHSLILLSLRFTGKKSLPHIVIIDKPKHAPQKKFLRTLVLFACVPLLFLQFFFAFSHAVILPTYHIDSLTNWTMRSKVSFYDHAIAFDATEVRGVAKPHYPFLFHSAQLIVNEGNTDWNDRSANAILFCVTLASLTSMFLLLQRKKGSDTALLGITLLIGVPLVSFHLSQGYADIILIQYLLLSCITLWLYRREANIRWLLLSSVFIAAAVWTKSEGMIVGLILWLIMLLPEILNATKRAGIWVPIMTSLLLSLPFPSFLIFHGMSLTPHHSDTSIGWHPDAFATAFGGLFTGGSMGITWFAVPILIVLFLKLTHAHDKRIDRTALPLGMWGAFSLCIILFTYIFTPNAVFLESGESYYRQLMIPATLLILWCVILWKENDEAVHLRKP